MHIKDVLVALVDCSPEQWREASEVIEKFYGLDNNLRHIVSYALGYSDSLGQLILDVPYQGFTVTTHGTDEGVIVVMEDKTCYLITEYDTFDVHVKQFNVAVKN